MKDSQTTNRIAAGPGLIAPADILEEEFPDVGVGRMSANHRTSWPVGVTVMLFLSCWLAPLQAQEQAASPASQVMERVRVSEDGKGFVLADSGKTFVPWGFNFVGEFGRIVEEYWESDWPGVEEDFQRMRELGSRHLPGPRLR